ncbi:C-X-C motif chemokine 10 Small-inducible cytokine B10 Precursor [Channa argus]|uniref:C-X-C motif chemokine 10 Small-inducible cytokine B10 n=1 Tax=Channa argus TaxID=215402 RepID=A0A6G1PUC3_CHAAH|nr:C-X-C motif chemokine 10 Small-inducible cytokine B10 Precursor [Channa argus]KAK2904077.1 hypothetical protein Q8A73_010734 [Channa argus]
MSCIMKAFLLLAAVICLSKAQLNESGQQCLCQRVRRGIGMRSEFKDIQIYPATIFCDKVEIVVTMNSGLRYCLNPQINTVKKILANIMKQKHSTTARPAVATPKSGSSSKADI